MRRMKLYLLLALLASGSLLAQEKVKYDQYGMEVQSTEVKTEMQDGRLVFESDDADYKI